MSLSCEIKYLPTSVRLLIVKHNERYISPSPKLIQAVKSKCVACSVRETQFDGVQYLESASLHVMSTTRGAIGYAARQNTPRSLWDPKFHYRIHMSSPVVHVLSQTTSAHTILSTQCYSSTYVLICQVVSFPLVSISITHTRSSSPHSLHVPSSITLVWQNVPTANFYVTSCLPFIR